MWNIIDSSAWLEFFGNTKNADHFSKIIEKNNKIIIPTIVLYEVFKLLLIKFDKSKAVEGIAQMKRSLVIDLNDDLALKAARISQKEKIPMADSIILATARQHEAIIWTLDADFKNFENVKYFPKK